MSLLHNAKKRIAIFAIALGLGIVGISMGAGKASAVDFSGKFKSLALWRCVNRMYDTLDSQDINHIGELGDIFDDDDEVVSLPQSEYPDIDDDGMTCEDFFEKILGVKFQSDGLSFVTELGYNKIENRNDSYKCFTIYPAIGVYSYSSSAWKYLVPQEYEFDKNYRFCANVDSNGMITSFNVYGDDADIDAQRTRLEQIYDEKQAKGEFDIYQPQWGYEGSLFAFYYYNKEIHITMSGRDVLCKGKIDSGRGGLCDDAGYYKVIPGETKWNDLVNDIKNGLKNSDAKKPDQEDGWDVCRDKPSNITCLFPTDSFVVLLKSDDSFVVDDHLTTSIEYVKREVDKEQHPGVWETMRRKYIDANPYTDPNPNYHVFTQEQQASFYVHYLEAYYDISSMMCSDTEAEAKQKYENGNSTAAGQLTKLYDNNGKAKYCYVKANSNSLKKVFNVGLDSQGKDVIPRMAEDNDNKIDFSGITEWLLQYGVDSIDTSLVGDGSLAGQGDDDYGGGDDGGGDTQYQPDTCYSGSGVLGWVLCPAIEVTSQIGEHLWEQIEQNHLKLPANALFGISPDAQAGTEAAKKSGVRIAWERVRDLANIVFVIIFLLIIVSQISGIGISNYGIKKMLPKFIVAILLVNLSYVICQLTVDICNTIGMSINNFLESIAGQIQGSASWAAGNSAIEHTSAWYEASGWIALAIIAGGGVTLFALFSSMGAGNIIGGIVLFILGIIIIVAVAMLTLYVTLVIRDAAIVIAISIAPLAIVCNVLPNTEPLFKKWLNLFKALMVLYPVCGFVIGASKVAGIILASTGLNSMRLAAGIVQVVPYFFIPSLLRKSLAGLGNIGSKINGLGRSWGRRASQGAQRGIRNTKRYQEMSKLSAARATDRRNRRISNRLSRKRDRQGGRLNETDAYRLNAAMLGHEDYAKQRDTEQTNTKKGRQEARMLKASTELKKSDNDLMLTYGGAELSRNGTVWNPNSQRAADYAKSVLRQGAVGTEKSVKDTLNYNRDDYMKGVRIENDVANDKNLKDKVAIGQNESAYRRANQLKNDLAREDEMEKLNAIAANASNYRLATTIKNQLNLEDEMGKINDIAQNANMYRDATRLKNATERSDAMKQLASTWGGAKYDRNGNLIQNADGTYKTDAQRAAAYAKGKSSAADIANHKDAEDKVNQAQYASRLFKANAVKGEIDRDAQTRAMRAFSESLDENGNFISDPGSTGKVAYRAADYQKNYATKQQNALASTLAAGHTKNTEVSFGSAYAENQQKYKSEQLQLYQTQYANMGTGALLQEVEKMKTSFNKDQPGNIQKVAALVSTAISTKNEKAGQTLLDAVTKNGGMDITEMQELARSINPGEVAGVKAFCSAILNAESPHAYSDFFMGTGGTGNVSYDDTGARTSAEDMLSYKVLAGKKDGGVTNMDPDTIEFADVLLTEQVKAAGAAGAGVRQTTMSGAQILHNILTVQKKGTQGHMGNIIKHTDPAEFANLQISGAEVTSKMTKEQLDNIKLLADNEKAQNGTDTLEKKLQEIVKNLTPEQKGHMEPSNLKFWLDNYGPPPAPGSGGDDDGDSILSGFTDDHDI